MKATGILWVGTLVGICYFLMPRGAGALPPQQPLVRLAELEIDPAKVDDYKAALEEEIAVSIQREPGVLKLYAVSVRGHANQIRLFEMYKDQASYEAHLNSPHFRRYKAATEKMVKALKLFETDPVLLGGR